MKHRRAILIDLLKIYYKTDTHARVFPHTLPNFKENYMGVIDQLLGEELLTEAKLPDADGQRRMAIAINPEKLARVREELNVWYKDKKFIIPAVISSVALLASNAGIYFSHFYVSHGFEAVAFEADPAGGSFSYAVAIINNGNRKVLVTSASLRLVSRDDVCCTRQIRSET